MLLCPQDLRKPHVFCCEGNIKTTEVPKGKFASYLHKQFPNRNRAFRQCLYLSEGSPPRPMVRIVNEFYLTLLLFYKTNTKNSMHLN